ncbi:MAG: UDP-N-acetylmuramoylalanine--D-glutamate ligase [Actinomycetota bacterium]|nr:UDP-N-acetylmuramoylalanine--D-glutamate ligase [Actinomycetota bacterium]
MTRALPVGSVLIVGFRMAGEALAAHLLATGWQVVAVDDAPANGMGDRARAMGIELLAHPGADDLHRLVAAVDVVAPSPGIPVGHPVFAAAAEAAVPVLGELELAWRSIDVPVVAVTGTNGKTTVTTLVALALQASGQRVLAAGNIGVPLVSAVGADLDVVVAEVSSFQLQFVDGFRPAVAVWLNLAPDHLDWHPDEASYAAAKARIWERQGPGDVAVVNAYDPVIMALAAGAPGDVVTFSLQPGGHTGFRGAGADWTVVDGTLRGPGGPVVSVSDLPRSLPHDLANALAAAAAATAAGATPEGIRSALTGFAGLPHRLTLVGEAAGIRFYDDSKATNPHAAVAAVQAFDSVVLVAGGRNKGLDLGALADAAVVSRIRSVVAIGEAGPEVTAVFDGVRPVQSATSMDEAVRLAAAAARAGDAVVLSPGCASFDWYGSYAQRGDDFARAVRALLQEEGAP